MRNAFTTTATLLATLGLLLVLIALLWPQPSRALDSVNVRVIGGIGSDYQGRTVTINQRIQQLAQQIQTDVAALRTKEYQLDPAVSQAKSRVAADYYVKQRQYLARGKDNEPRWIVNVEKYLSDIAEGAASSSLKEIEESGNACDAFKDDVIKALKDSYKENSKKTVAQKNTCELDSASEGETEAFLSGDFPQDTGVQSLWAIWQNPENTPVGNFVANQDRIAGQAAEATGNALIRANWSDGFKDVYQGNEDVIVCTQGEENGIRDNCRVSTPGSFVRERMANLLNIEFQLKTQADEYQENAELNFLDGIITQTLARGIDGRANETSVIPAFAAPPTVTPPGGGGGGSGGGNCEPGTWDNPYPLCYPQQYDNLETIRFAQETLQAAQSDTNNPAAAPIQRVYQKLAMEVQSIVLVNNIEAIYNATSTYYMNEPGNNGCWSLIPFSSELQNRRTTSEDRSANTIFTLKQLRVLFDDYNAAVAAGNDPSTIVARISQIASETDRVPTQQMLTDPSILGPALELERTRERYAQYLGSVADQTTTSINGNVNYCESIINAGDTTNTNNNNEDFDDNG